MQRHVAFPVAFVAEINFPLIRKAITCGDEVLVVFEQCQIAEQIHAVFICEAFKTSD